MFSYEQNILKEKYQQLNQVKHSLLNLPSDMTVKDINVPRAPNIMIVMKLRKNCFFFTWNLKKIWNLTFLVSTNQRCKCQPENIKGYNSNSLLSQAILHHQTPYFKANDTTIFYCPVLPYNTPHSVSYYTCNSICEVSRFIKENDEGYKKFSNKEWRLSIPFYFLIV